MATASIIREHMHIQLNLPMPDEGNEAPFRADVCRVVAEHGFRFEGRLLVNIVLYQKDQTKLDIGKKVSVLISALENAGCFDSEQIHELVVARQVPKPEARCMVIVMPIEWSIPLGD